MKYLYKTISREGYTATATIIINDKEQWCVVYAYRDQYTVPDISDHNFLKAPHLSSLESSMGDITKKVECILQRDIELHKGRTSKSVEQLFKEDGAIAAPQGFSKRVLPSKPLIPPTVMSYVMPVSGIVLASIVCGILVELYQKNYFSLCG